MPLHDKHPSQQTTDDEVYASSDLPRVMPRRRRSPAHTLSPTCGDLSIQRILVRQGVSRDLASLLVADMKHTLEYLERHPVETQLTSAEASGFHH